VRYFCLSELFHTCRQAASVTPPCKSLAFILNELSFQLEGRQNKGFRTTRSWWARSSLTIIYFGAVPLRAVLSLAPSWPRHSHLVCCCFISRQVRRPVVSGPVETWYESDTSLLHETKE